MNARFLPFLLLPLALSACSGGAPASPQAQCEAQSYNDPEVRALIAKGAGSQWIRVNTEGELTAARKRATLDCLRRRGLAAPGGVEPVRPSNSLWDSLF